MANGDDALPPWAIPQGGDGTGNAAARDKEAPLARFSDLRSGTLFYPKLLTELVFP